MNNANLNEEENAQTNVALAGQAERCVIKIDVDPTAEAIKKAASRLRDAADALDRIADKMVKNNDISYAAEATIEVINVVQNSRLDLFVTRPIREMQRFL